MIPRMPEQSYFSRELFAFLRQLKGHNNREWFARNKKRYQQVLVEPALRFIAEFALPLSRLAPHFVADARPTRGSLFRIYRDTRFSPDKQPYKTHAGIRFAHESGKDVHGPVFYFHLEPGNCFAAAGVWHPDNRTLTRIRSAIVASPERWRKATRRLELEGESLTRPPKGFPPDHPFVEDLKRKDFVSTVALSEEQACGPRLMRDFTAACRTMLPLVEFTTRAVGLKF
jgi:uncharacterized protein (TIGR02453 family)